MYQFYWTFLIYTLVSIFDGWVQGNGCRDFRACLRDDVAGITARELVTHCVSFRLLMSSFTYPLPFFDDLPLIIFSPHNPLARTRRWERAVEGFFCCISFAGLRPLPNRYFVAAFLLIELWTRCARQWRRNDDTKAVRQSAAGPVEFRLPDRISIDRTVFFTEKRKLKKISSSECFFSELATVVAVSTRFNWIVTSFYRAL